MRVRGKVTKKSRSTGSAGTISSPEVHINDRRLIRDLNAVSRIGIGSHGSVTRLVFSVQDLRSRQLFIHLMNQAGLKVRMDQIGNVFGRLEGRRAKEPAVMVGSHLDTVVQGGKFDGAVGVVGALEAVRTLKENRVFLASPVEVVCFVGEESSRFGFSTLGSSLMTGEIGLEDLAHAVDQDGTKLGDVLSGMGVHRKNLASLRRNPASLKAYLELHIEQGPILEAKKKRIGVVTSIAAP
ncbi:MAG: M20/M25/M40 family metallo-hydrolase, partial [Candidatus Binatia bacterium]|nr:M20/M25/M40 family metallo-hydrolase [Candidatus Binatia bacterium]